jgi:hypothetical protein
MSKCDVIITATVEDADVEELLTVVTEFNNAHRDSCHVQVGIEGSSLRVEEVKRMFQRLGLPIIFAAEKVQ